MKVMVITDNEFLYKNFKDVVSQDEYSNITFDYFFSECNESLKKKYTKSDFKPINIKCCIDKLISNYQLILSLHCKQLFPKDLVEKVRCVNVHPGFNPYNRGWFPQIFSIINKLPVGVTIHEMDEKLDHGMIVVQEEVNVFSWETSYEVYQKIQKLEIELLRTNLSTILDNSYKATPPLSEGNVNLKKDFDDLCRMDLDKIITFREAIDFFRAMSFADFKNAYFFDESGRKVFVTINLELEPRVHNEE